MQFHNLWKFEGPFFENILHGVDCSGPRSHTTRKVRFQKSCKPCRKSFVFPRKQVVSKPHAPLAPSWPGSCWKVSQVAGNRPCKAHHKEKSESFFLDHRSWDAHFDRLTFTNFQFRKPAWRQVTLERLHHGQPVVVHLTGCCICLNKTFRKFNLVLTKFPRFWWFTSKPVANFF